MSAVRNGIPMPFLRKVRTNSSVQILQGCIEFQAEQHRRLIDLTLTEHCLLETLARHAHRTLPAETLLSEVWGPEYVGEVESVKHAIWTLRSKIEVDPGDPKHIITERGFGYWYRFEFCRE